MTCSDTNQASLLERLNALDAISGVKAKYFRLMDTKSWDEWQALFTPDAVMDMAGEATAMRSLGFDIGQTRTPIIPVVIGELVRTLQLWRALFDEGVFTHPIVPPAVPPTSCRLRVSMSAEHSDEQVDRVLDAFERVARMMVAA